MDTQMPSPPSTPIAGSVATPTSAAGTEPVIASETLLSPQAQAQATATPQQNSSPAEEILDTSNLTSKVWAHFLKVRLINGDIKARCKYCRKLLGGDSNHGTSHLKTYSSNCLQRKIHDGSQKILGPDFNSKGKKDIAATVYNAEVSRKLLGIAIVMHEYLLSMVGHYYFKDFISSLQPLFRLPCRNTIRKDILGTYACEKVKIHKQIDGNKGRIAIITDMWTASNQKKGYMAVTAHYVDNNWHLRNHMLRFMYVPAPHNANKLASILVHCMLSWNVDAKVSTITLDNCSTNDRMIEIIKTKLVPSYLIKEGDLLHMRCCAHILNLIVKDGLDVLKGGIEKIRDSSNYWIATPKRVEFFQESAKQLRIPCVKKLVHDCPTRWNSTYYMLSVALPYKDVFYRLRQRDPNYTSCPSESDWEFAALVCKKLEIFSEISDLFSGTSYPTANLFFLKICDLNEALSEWLLDSHHVIRNMAELMWLKFSKYWTDIHEILAVAVVLDPRYKLDIIEFYEMRLANNACRVSHEKIKQVMTDLIQEYQSKNAPIDHQPSNEVIKNSTTGEYDFDLYVSQRKRSKTAAYQTELDSYLNEAIIPRSSDFDILMWWKMNGVKFPTLQAIAKDVLAIPITSVASESSFSAGGRLLDPHRSRLHYTMVESMMCTRSWIKDDLKLASESDANALEGCFTELHIQEEEDTIVDEAENGRSNYHLDD